MCDYVQFYKNFGAKLKSVRRERRLKQREVSAITGIDRSLYAKYETGAVLPTCIGLYQIAKALEVSADYLLGLENE